jgi:nitric oxide reductase subunit B
MRHAGGWLALGVVTIGSFAALGAFGGQIYRMAPPIPDRVVTADGRLLFTGETILDGQAVWQSVGGQELGSIWGHGAYVAPDWSADWLHRECLWLLDRWARHAHGRAWSELSSAEQAPLRERLTRELRTNTHDPGTNTLVVSSERAASIDAMTRYYGALFGDAAEFDADLRVIADDARAPPALREAYAMPANTIPDAERRAQLAAFFQWTAWACATERPEAAVGPREARNAPPVTYTNNWPSEPLIDNRPSGSIVVWSVASFVLLLAGVGALAWWFAVRSHHAAAKADVDEPPADDPLLQVAPTPSMQATLKYFWVVAALLVLQVLLGAVTAHYGVEGNGFYGFPLADWLPYAVTRTWHVQLGIFWIATAWLATGLYVAPAISGKEPEHQRLGVNVLFGALLVVVLGTLVGTWLSTRQTLDLGTSYWIGHQGYEYVDLGRLWQVLLLVGLFLWLGLVTRALWPAFRQPGEHKHLLGLFLIASAAIGLFYAAGLMYGQRTHLALAEYWRWWVVHLWVEGFFEVFATVVIAFLFTRMGLLRVVPATAAVLFSTAVFLAGGILGTFHHLYFSGTPTSILALGAMFSALEVVPLVLIGFEAYENLRLGRAPRAWVAAYRWPITFFVAVAFWNLVGAGLFGFFINPPIALYYMQGLNTTPVHGHTALFGVYGMLAIGLLLFCLRGLTTRGRWRTGPIAFSFWAINGGLSLMVLLSLLPVGLLQTWASVEHGLWYARSAEFMQAGAMNTLRWLRVIGDTMFAFGALGLGWFVLGLKTGWSLERHPDAPTPVAPPTPAGARA